MRAPRPRKRCCDCGDDTPSCRSSRKARFCIRGLGTRAPRPRKRCCDYGDDTPSCRSGRQTRLTILCLGARAPRPRILRSKPRLPLLCNCPIVNCQIVNRNHCDCGDDTPPCRSSRKARFCIRCLGTRAPRPRILRSKPRSPIQRLWRRHALVSFGSSDPFDHTAPNIHSVETVFHTVSQPS